MDERVEHGLAQSGVRNGESLHPLDTLVADSRLEVLGQQQVYRPGRLTEQIAMYFIVVEQIGVVAEETGAL